MNKEQNKTPNIVNTIRHRINKLKEKAASLKQQKTLDVELEEGLATLKTQEVKVDLDKVVVELTLMSVFKSVLVVLMVLVGAYLVYSIGSILVVFFISFFIAAALDPLVDLLQSYHVPRAVGLLLIYVLVFFLVALLFAQLLPLIASQLIGIATLVNNFIVGISNNSVSNLPFGAQIKPFLDELYKAIDFKVVAVQLQSSLQLISSQLVNLGGNLWSVILQISNGMMNFMLILILVFFMTVDENALENFCISVFPAKYSGYISHRMQMVKNKIGEWIRGQFFVSMAAGVITFIGLAIAGVNYSLTISLIAGVCMIIPVFGRVVAAIIALPIVLNQSPALALFLIIYYFAISQVENNIMVPLFMNKAVGLSPIMIIFSLLVGFQLMGVLGLVLAVPIATIIAIFAKDLGRRIHSSR